MNPLSIEEWELLGLFEREPDRLGLDDLWPFDSSAYRFESGDIRLILAIHPYHKDVRIILKYGDCVLYDHDRMSVADVILKNDILTVVINDGENINIQLRPQISIHHQVRH